MNHVELTIADLEAARNRADLLIQGLREFQSGCDITAAPTAAVVLPVTGNGRAAGAGEDHPAPVRITTKPGAPQGTTKQAKPHKNTPKGRGVQDKLFAVAATLPEPFTATDLDAAAKTDNRKQCENFLVHRITSGMFARAGRGEYKRGKKFPVQSEGTKLTKRPLQVRKLCERPGLVPMARGDARPTTPAVSTESLLANKPTTIGAAMKLFIRTLTEFTGEQLRTALQADKDYAKLLEQSYTGFAGNLAYWTNQGHLNKDGDGALDALYTVTGTGREWFNK